MVPCASLTTRSRSPPLFKLPMYRTARVQIPERGRDARRTRRDRRRFAAVAPGASSSVGRKIKIDRVAQMDTGEIDVLLRRCS